MTDVAIRAEGLGKLYRIGGPRTGSDRLGERLLDAATAPLRRAGRLLRGDFGAANGLDEPLWALRDVSFAIRRGDVVGIIGHNGAGKSTLLKILSRITDPSEGHVDMCGRVGSLLEVGTGFHPDLTGRHNVFLNGALLGMRRAEIERKFDAIVAFAEIESFIDTPVKHYSSGMYVRLAFSVAAHLEPEILLVDEVLAVGDVNFQKKCLRKIDEVSGQGRTVVFVSHNMNAVQRLCSTCILLQNGRLVAVDDTRAMILRYLEANAAVHGPGDWIDLRAVDRVGSGRVRFTAVSYGSANPDTAHQPYPHGPLEILVDVVADSSRAIGSLAVTLSDRYGTKLVNADTVSLGDAVPLRAGHNRLRLRIDELYLNPGTYTLGLWAADPPAEVHDRVDAAVVIEVIEREVAGACVEGVVPCRFRLEVS